MHSDLLLVFRHSPYGGSLGREGLEAALAAGAFDQNMAIIFLDDGVWQLKDKQNTQHINRKNHEKMASALPLFGVEKIYACTDSLKERNLNAEGLHLNISTLGASKVRSLMASAKHILSF